MEQTPFDLFIETLINVSRDVRHNHTNKLNKILGKHPEFINKLTNVRGVEDSYPPLQIAIMKRACPQLIKYLIQHGADVNQPSKKGETALMRACDVGSADSLRILLEHGADVNQQSYNGDSALMIASYHDSVQSVQILLEHGADMDIQAKNGVTALMIASKGHMVLPILLQAGADIHLRTNTGDDVLMYAVHGSTNPDVIQLLLSAGADLHREKDNGETPLSIAANRNVIPGRDDIIQALLSAGADADINHKAKDGSTPLMWISVKGDPTITRKMLNAGADLNMADNNGWTPLMYISNYGGPLSVMRLLVDKGANVDIQDNNGMTALMHAVYSSRADIVEYLLSIGAETKLLNKSGKNVTKYASTHMKELMNRLVPHDGGRILKRRYTKKRRHHKKT